MTPDQAKKVKDEIESEPQLFSARHNRDYETMAIFWNQKFPDQTLSEVDIHQIMKG